MVYSGTKPTRRGLQAAPNLGKRLARLVSTLFGYEGIENVLPDFAVAAKVDQYGLLSAGTVENEIDTSKGLNSHRSIIGHDAPKPRSTDERGVGEVAEALQAG